MTLFVFMILSLTTPSDLRHDLCTGDRIVGRYVNYAEGFSVGIPRKLIGRRVRVSGPERGVSIVLSRDCAGIVRFDGDPNPLEWATTAIAASETAGFSKDRGGFIVRRYKTRMGRLPASGVTVHYRDSQDVEDIVVAFRPRGGPMYTAELLTAASRYERDRKRFIDVLRRFRLEPWR
jgi:hypothetical protein